MSDKNTPDRMNVAWGQTPEGKPLLNDALSEQNRKLIGINDLLEGDNKTKEIAIKKQEDELSYLQEQLRQVTKERDGLKLIIDKIESRLGKGWVKELADAMLTAEENLNKLETK
jgi:hypothetical protein